MKYDFGKYENLIIYNIYEYILGYIHTHYINCIVYQYEMYEERRLVWNQRRIFIAKLANR